MSPLKISIFAALLSTALTAGAFYHFHFKKAGQAGYLRDQNTRLRYQAYENRRRAASSTAADRCSASNGDSTGTPAPAPGAKPVEYYRNAGLASPRDTLQTLAWACDRGDTETLTKLIHFEPTARTKAEDYLTRLPQAEQARWKSADDFVAHQLAFVVMASPFPNADVLDVASIESLSEGRAQFRLPGTRRDQTQFQKVGDNWKVVITEHQVDLLIKSVSEVEAANTAKR